MPVASPTPSTPARGPSHDHRPITSYTGDKVAVNPIAANGDVAQPPTTMLGTRPHAHSIVPDPSNRYVFASNLGGDAIMQYRFGSAAGTLTLLASTSVLPQGFSGGAPATSELHVTPDGRFLYVAERTSSTIAAFRIDSTTGALSLIGHTPTETQPRGFGMDPRGRFSWQSAGSPMP